MIFEFALKNEVLNLIINGISSILKLRLICLNLSLKVLNLIISGIPSILTAVGYLLYKF